MINPADIEVISQDFIKTQYTRPKSRECRIFLLLKDRLLTSSAAKDIPNEVTSEEIQRECNERPENISRVLAQIKFKLEGYNNTRYDDGLRLVLVKTRSSEDRRKIIAKLAIFPPLEQVQELEVAHLERQRQLEEEVRVGRAENQSLREAVGEQRAAPKPIRFTVSLVILLLIAGSVIEQFWGRDQNQDVGNQEVVIRGERGVPSVLAGLFELSEGLQLKIQAAGETKPYIVIFGGPSSQSHRIETPIYLEKGAELELLVGSNRLHDRLFLYLFWDGLYPEGREDGHYLILPPQTIEQQAVFEPIPYAGPRDQDVEAELLSILVTTAALELSPGDLSREALKVSKEQVKSWEQQGNAVHVLLKYVENKPEITPSSQDQPPKNDDFSAIKTWQDFVEAWQKRLGKGEGSSELLAFYNTLKAKPTVKGFEQCIALAEEEKDKWGKVVCLLSAYEMMDVPQPLTFEKAEEWTKRGGELAKEIVGYEAGPYAQSLHNLAFLLKKQGKLVAARPLYEQVLSLREKVLGPDHPDVADSLNGLAVLLKIQGEYAAAQPLCERALLILKKALGPDHPDVAKSLSNLASLFYAQGEYEKARQLLEQALLILEKALGPEHPDVAGSLNNLAALFWTQGNYAATRPLFERALAIFERILDSDHPELALSLNNLAKLHWKENNFTQAQSLFLKAAETVSRHIQKVFPALSLAEQRNFLALYFPNEFSLLLSACREEELLTKAYNQIFRWKGLLIESLRWQAVLTRLSEQAPTYRPLVDQLREVHTKIAGLYHNAGQMPLKEWEEENSGLTKRKEELERLLPSDLTKDVLQTIDLEKFRALLNSDEVFLDIYRYHLWPIDQDKKEVESHYAAIIMGVKAGPLLVGLGQAETIEKAVSVWFDEVLGKNPDETTWQEVAKLLWQPIVKVLPKGIRKVWVSPDGELSHIPWHLLPATEATTEKLLLSHIDSARQLVSLKHTEPIVTDKPSVFLAGGIDFGKGKGDFKPLNATIHEVQVLEKLAKDQKFPVTVLTERQVTKEAVISSLGKAKFAHLATHGFFAKEMRTASLQASRAPDPIIIPLARNVRNPLVESGIALTDANLLDPSAIEYAKGRLTAEEFIGVDLHSLELFTLSACKTGRGEAVTGQGVMGLLASILAAGARSMIMSLWDVPDKATAKLMEIFYTNLWKKKMTKVEALKQAQEAVRKDYKAPYYWAGWVIVGEGW